MEIWETIKQWLVQNAPEVGRSLNAPAAKRDIAWLQKLSGGNLESTHLSSLQCHDGQNDYGPPLIGDWLMLSIEASRRELKIMAGLMQTMANANSAVEPAVGVKACWFHEKWLPVAYDGAGNLICADYAPEDEGTNGQLVHFANESSSRAIIAASMGEWLESFAAKLSNGEYRFQDGRMTKK